MLSEVKLTKSLSLIGLPCYHLPTFVHNHMPTTKATINRKPVTATVTFDAFATNSYCCLVHQVLTYVYISTYVYNRKIKSILITHKYLFCGVLSIFAWTESVHIIICAIKYSRQSKSQIGAIAGPEGNKLFVYVMAV